VATDKPDRCAVCGRDPKRMNSTVAECSHVDCPNRRRHVADGWEIGIESRGGWKAGRDFSQEDLDELCF